VLWRPGVEQAKAGVGVSFKPARSRHGWYGLLACASLLAIDGLMLWLVATRPVEGLSFVLVVLVLLSLPLIVALAFRTWGCFALEYWVHRDGLIILWGPMRRAIPMHEIERIARGMPEVKPSRWQRLTRPPSEQLVLVTPTGLVGISPADPDGLLEVLQSRHRLGSARTLDSSPSWPLLWQWRFWGDSLAQGLLLGGLVLCLVVFGILAFRFPGLPGEVTLHFNAAGLADRVGPKQSLFVVPLIGLLSWLVNMVWGGFLYRRQPQASYLLWGGAALVQILAGMALRSLLS